MPPDPREPVHAPTVADTSGSPLPVRGAVDPATAPTHASGPGYAAAAAAFTPDTGSLRDGERYLERGVLGAGGMGEVRSFHDRHIGRDVARKTLLGELSTDPDARKRFVREVRVQGQIEHPAVVPVYDLFVEDDGTLAFTMKRVAGRTLREILAAIAAGDAATIARFSRRKLLTGFATVCLALDCAHGRGVVHRDLKPANVMFGDFGEVYVLDWGVAKVRNSDDPIDSPGSSRPGETGIVGTPAYMAPEQITGGPDGGVDARSDVYALGLVLYEILTGKALRETKSPLRVLKEIALEDPHPSRVAPDVPPELDAICARAAAAAPDDRYPTARALADAIEGYLDGDRDLERRRALAAEHAQTALALRGDGTGSGSPAAMAEVMRALALDPDNAEARRVLRGLLLEAPDHLPPAAEAELDGLRHAQRKKTLRAATQGWFAMAIPMPFTALLGNVKWAPTLTAFTMLGAMAALSWTLQSRARLTSMHFIAYVVSAAITTMAFSLWLGPFIMLPVGSAVITTLFGLACTKKERPWALVFGALATVVPIAAELLGIMPRSTFFETGRVVLVSRFADVEPTWTLLGLAWTSAAFAPFAGFVAGKMRDALADAERKLFAHAWHLRRIAPDDAD